MRRPTLWVSDQVWLKQGCTGSRGNVLSKQRKQMRWSSSWLPRNWSASFVFANTKHWFSHDVANMYVLLWDTFKNALSQIVNLHHSLMLTSDSMKHKSYVIYPLSLTDRSMFWQKALTLNWDRALIGVVFWGLREQSGQTLVCIVDHRQAYLRGQAQRICWCQLFEQCNMILFMIF